MKFTPVIVVVAFNRPKSLERVLHSLSMARIPDETRLIISIDNAAPGNYPVRDIAKAYQWPFGEKEVRYQEERLGLKKHVMQCAGLSREYGSVIILEDDLYVSPHFYHYASEALEFYEEDDRIGGISLYRQPFNEMNLLPFTPIHEDSDVFFLMFPSSWGQAWTWKHWDTFMAWHEKNPDITNIIHRNMLGWPDTSWKKHFSAFLITSRKYFVFPRVSLTTNFNDPGTHLKDLVNHDGQAQLKMMGESFRFRSLDESHAIYDHLLELNPETVKQLNPGMRQYDFEMDLYGLKETDKVQAEYIFTTQPVKKFLFSLKRALKPHEMNVIFELEGEDIFFCRTEDVILGDHRQENILADYKYHYSRYLPGWKARIRESIRYRMEKLKR